MAKSRVKNFLLSLFTTSLCLWNVTCSTYPVDTSKRDILEIERVGQYLKVYSIWQDKVPQNVFEPDIFETPQQVFKSVHDTFSCWNPLYGGAEYTGYYNDSTSGILSKKQADGNSSGLLYIHPLTSKTVQLVITTFESDSIVLLFKKHLDTLSTFSNIIIDLRNNTGGDIKTIDTLLEYFLPPQTPYLNATYRDYNESQRTAQTVSEVWETHTARSPSLVNKRIAVLFNTWSASASEMLIAGLKDGKSKNANGDTVVLVGQRSYGKGMGQIVISRSYLNRPDIKITFLRVQRTCGCPEADYHRKGIKPDLTVVNTTAQLNAALHCLEPNVAPLPKETVTAPISNLPAEGYKVISPISSIEQ